MWAISGLYRKDNQQKKRRHFSAGVATMIVGIALTISILTTITMENYFVKKLTYKKNMLFVGSNDKEKHIRIIEEYYMVEFISPC